MAKEPVYRLRILVLDDQLKSVSGSLMRSLGDFVRAGTPVPDLEELDGQESQVVVLDGLVDGEVHVTFKGNKATVELAADVAAQLKKGEYEGLWDVVLIDDNWLEDFGGQDILLPEAYSYLKGESPELPLLCLFTRHWGPVRLRRFYKTMLESGREWMRIVPCNKGDGLQLLHVLYRAISTKKIADERTTAQKEASFLRQRVEREQRVAHAPYGLLQHVRHLVGIDDLLLELAEAVDPFFQWNSGDYDNIPEPLRCEFSSGLLFEGEPGGGKSTLCKAIANSFGSHAVLPKHLGPTTWQGKWKKELGEYVERFYKMALQQQVVVIQADDLVWPSAARVVDGGLQADWTAYLNTLRECVEDAAQINRGKRPTGSIASTIKGTFQGKILWLFARNRDEEVGPMFEPLRQKLLAFRIEFPRDGHDREAVLSFHAEKQRVVLAGDVLSFAVGKTINYSGRDLIGDETGQRGFLCYAIRKVRQRELKRHKDGFSVLDMSITKDIVEEWLKSKEHAEITRRLGETGQSDPPMDDHPDGSVRALVPSEKERAKAREVLDWLEEACEKLRNEKWITQDMIAKVHGCSRPNVTERFNLARMAAVAFLDAFPRSWPCLQNKTDIRSWGLRKRGGSSKAE